MNTAMSIGEAARELDIEVHNLRHAILRSGAPYSEKRVGGKRVFFSDDIEALRKWFAKNRKYESAAV